MWKYKKILISTFCILTLFFLLDRCLSLALGRIVLQSQNRFSDLYAGRIDTDVLIIGNSRGVNTFYAPAIEEKLGLKAFNLSYNGMSMEMARILFLDFLERNRSPELLILEITNLNNDDILLLNLKQYCRLSPRLDHALMTKLPAVAKFIDLSHLYAFNSEFFLRTLYYLFRSDKHWINNYKIHNGYLTNYTPPERTIRSFDHIDADALEALSDIISTCEKNQIRVRFVIGPYLPDHIRKVSSFDVWKSSLESVLGSDHTLLDYSSSIENPSYFADPIHLNKDGALVLLPKLIDADIFDLGQNENISHKAVENIP